MYAYTTSLLLTAAAPARTTLDSSLISGHVMASVALVGYINNTFWNQQQGTIPYL